MPKREVKAAVEGSSAVTVRIVVSTHMFLVWARIALKREHEAHEARAKMMRVPSNTGYMTEETEASLQTVVAVASALEALRHEMAHRVAPETVAAWEAQARGTAGQVFATLRLAFELPGEDWLTRLRTLFDRRNQAVHPKWRQEETAPHPSGLHNTSREHVEFASESAKEACDLLTELLRQCIRNPMPALEKWAADMTPQLGVLDEIRETRRRRREDDRPV